MANPFCKPFPETAPACKPLIRLCPDPPGPGPMACPPLARCSLNLASITSFVPDRDHRIVLRLKLKIETERRYSGQRINPHVVVSSRRDARFNRMMKKLFFTQAAQKGPDPRRRAGYPSARMSTHQNGYPARGVLSAYVAAPRERAGYPSGGWVPGDGPFSAAC